MMQYLLEKEIIGAPQNSSLSDLKAQIETCLVIGGGFGFLGTHLVQALLENNCCVRILSHVPVENLHPKVELFRGDIRNLEELLKACEGINTVFHVASVILPSGFMNQKTKEYIYDVNVKGTENVIQACRQCGVSRLIYTSSNNVVFDHAIANGDETLPYAKKFFDVYTKTKVLSEKKIINANNHLLLTCALRPGGIYGPGDRLILMRLVEALKKGQLLFTIGNKHVLADSVYIENLVNAHLLAASKLKKGSPAAGQVYFISDGEPSNYFEFLRPLILSMGYRFPSFSIPFIIAYPMAFVAELFHWLFDTPKPFLTRMEVRKVSLTNYFSIEKAKRDLGYIPPISQKQGIEKSLPYCLELLANMKVVKRPHFGWWICIMGGMTILGILAFQPEAYAFFANHITALITVTHLKILFLLAILIHIGEAFYALKVANQAGLANTARGWFLQTLILGYPSLRLLLGTKTTDEKD